MSAAALTISRSQWLEHQHTIYDLYVTQGLELKAIRQQLIDNHSFSASIPQYKRKLKEWKYAKNLKASVCRAIGSGLERRGLTHNTATTVVGGVVLSPDRLQRALRRHDIPTLGRKWKRRSPTPEDVEIQRKSDSSALSSSLASDATATAFQTAGLPTARANERLSPDSATDHMRTEPLTRQQPSTTAGVVSRVQNGEAAHGSPGLSGALSTAILSSPSRRLEVEQTPLSCTHCRYLAKSRSELNQHRLVHESLHTCPVSSCPRNTRGFVTLNELERHIQKGHDRNALDVLSSYKCFDRACVGLIEKFYQRSRFIAHIRETHGEHCVVRLLAWSNEWSVQTGQQTPDTAFDDLDITILTSRSNFQEIQSMLEQGADINAVGEHGSLFERAFIWGNCDLVRYLLQHGARPEVPSDHRGRTSVQIAIDCGLTQLPKLLIEHCAHANVLLPDDHVDAFILACRTGDVPLAQLLIEYGVDVSAPLWNGRTLLHDACCRKDVEIVKVLVEAGADVNAPLENGRTALYDACSRKDVEIVKVLVEAGADVNVPLENGRTALYDACSRKDVEIVEVLVEAGADVNASLTNGRTALYDACCGKDVKIVKVLVEAGADVNARPWNGRTLLQDACWEGNVEVVKILVEAGADVNAPAGPYFRYTALQAAASWHYVDVARILLHAGADVAAPSSVRGTSALNDAARKGHPDMLELLLDKCYHSEQFESFQHFCGEASKYADYYGHSQTAQVLSNLAKGIFDPVSLRSAGMDPSYWYLCIRPTQESHG